MTHRRVTWAVYWAEPQGQTLTPVGAAALSRLDHKALDLWRQRSAGLWGELPPAR
ncbi:hypothetical protein ACFP81_09345 [Deinococcus lacus]|uniref:Uncharacterized protein n=1 Tax=Deinococcus lacus TaxID=392561 RepID=A0ABW1YCZ4_9DEIO